MSNSFKDIILPMAVAIESARANRTKAINTSSASPHLTSIGQE